MNEAVNDAAKLITKAMDLVNIKRIRTDDAAENAELTDAVNLLDQALDKLLTGK